MSVQPARPSRVINGVSYLTMIFLGVYLSVYQSVLGDIGADFKLSAALTGLMISFHFLGSFLLPLLLGEAGDHLGTKPVVLASFALLTGGILLVALSRSHLVFLAATLLIGGGFAVIEGLLTGLLALANPQRVNAVMNLSQMYFCLGAVAGPFVAWLTRQLGLAWRSNYFLMAAIFALCLLLMARQELPVYKTEPIKGLYLKQLGKSSYFIVLLLAIFLYVGVEEGAAFWVTHYVEATSQTLIPAGFFLAAYWLGMALGRLFFSRLRERYNSWLIGGLVLAGIFVSLFLFGGSAPLKLIWLFMVGFGFAPAWPVLMMQASEHGSAAPNTAMGAMMASGAFGGMVVPYLLGQLSDWTGLQNAMFLLLALVALLTGLLLLKGKKHRI